jgi:hypothetical protein
MVSRKKAFGILKIDKSSTTRVGDVIPAGSILTGGRVISGENPESFYDQKERVVTAVIDADHFVAHCIDPRN